MLYQKGSTPLVLVLFIVIFLGIVGGAYYLGKNSQNNSAIQPTVSLSTSSQQTPSPATTNLSKVVTTPTPTPDPTAKWKTYSNQKYGYSIKYPDNLKTDESETSYDQYTGFTLGRDSSGNAYLPNYTVTVAKSDFQAKDPVSVNFMSADWINTFYNMNVGDTKTANTVTFQKVSNEKVAGQNAAVVQVIASGSNQKRYFLKADGYVYMISDFSNSADFQNVLSTFRFIN